jgi:catechol 2,3-dioxygenase-like lactoylglutathione lyase family enzyme
MSAATFAPAQREQANLRLGTADQASGHVAAGLKYFHLNLNVADVDKAVAFYKVLFGQEPFKHYPDFAEFVVSGPALVLDLTRYPCVAGGPINHIGLRFIDPDLLEELRQRLEGAGFAPNNQGSVNCCYAKGNKVWAVDPDHNLLELYVFQGDLPQFGFEEPPAQAEQSTGVIWEHRLPTELPTSIPHADGTIDEVQLVGTFNGGFPPEQLNALLAEAIRVLRPGGKVQVQGMVSDIPYPGTPALPGLASRIKSVPLESGPVDVLRDARFVNVYYEQLGDIKCIKVDGVQLRKFRLGGTKPAASTTVGGYAMSYRGPFEEIETDDGHVLHRGKTVEVEPGVWDALRRGPAQKQFLFYAPAERSCCSPTR